MQSLYEVIGVPRNATQVEIEAACLKLGDKFRPDKNSGDAVSAQVFNEIEHAYTVLSDPIARRAYDFKLIGGGVIDPESSSPKTISGFSRFWRARSTFSKVVLSLLLVSALGNLIVPTSDKSVPALKSSTEPLPSKKISSATPEIPAAKPEWSPEEAKFIDGSSFRFHLGVISNSQQVQDLADRDRVVHSGRLVLLIVTKVIDRQSASPKHSADCKKRFSETLLRTAYLKRFEESFNKSSLTEDSIVRALRETVGCEI